MPEALETWPVEPLRGDPAAPPPDHLRDQPPLSRGGAPPLPRRRGPAPAHVDRGRGRAAGGCAWRTWPSSGSHQVNGVSQIHTDLMKKTIFADFEQFFPGQDHQHHERHHAAPLAAPGQSGPVRAHHVAHRRRLGQRSRRAQEARAPGRGRGVPAASSARSSATNKERLAEIIKMRLKLDGRPGVAVRRADQAHPRIQAAAPERAAYRDPVQPHPRGPRPGHGAAHRDLRRQGRARATPWPSSSSSSSTASATS